MPPNPKPQDPEFEVINLIVRGAIAKLEEALVDIAILQLFEPRLRRATIILEDTIAELEEVLEE